MEFNSSNLMELMHLLQSIDCKTTYEKLQEVVLFIGKTGDGKSTLTEFLAENPNLMSEGEDGEYVIMDRTSKRIGDADTTILSQTSYPFPVWPRTSKIICYLDCPGFQDTRNSSADICCTICTKKALMRCRVVKIILVINYEDVKKGGQRNGFLDLVKHATGFIKVLDNFKSSIALFVTKVPNSTQKVNGKLEYVADEVVKERIANFLQTVKTTILGIQDVPEEKLTLYENAIKLINILMSDGRPTTRIGIFRCPDEAGPIQKIDLLQNCKKALDTIIEDVLRFTVPGRYDFGYTISAETKDCITKGVNQIVGEIEPILGRILQRIETTYEVFENETQSIQELYNKFKKQYSLWEDANQKLLNSRITSDALNYLLSHMRKLFSSDFFLSRARQFNTRVNKQEVDDLHPYANLLQLFEEVSSEKFPISTSKWVVLYKKTEEVTRAAKVWYSTIPLIITLLKNAAEDERKTRKVSFFMGVLEGWACNNTSVSSETFLKRFDSVFEEQVGLQMDINISAMKIRHLHRMSSDALDGKLDEATSNFLYTASKAIIRHVVLRPADWVLRIFSGRWRDVFSGNLTEVKKASQD